MGFLSDLEHRLIRFNNQVREVAEFGKPPSHLGLDDHDDFMTKARMRQPPRTRAEIISAVSARAPMRYARLKRDMRWLEKQAVKHGLSPEDARWLV